MVDGLCGVVDGLCGVVGGLCGVVDAICGATYDLIGSTTPQNTQTVSTIDKIMKQIHHESAREIRTSKKNPKCYFDNPSYTLA